LNVDENVEHISN